MSILAGYDDGDEKGEDDVGARVSASSFLSHRVFVVSSIFFAVAIAIVIGSAATTLSFKPIVVAYVDAYVVAFEVLGTPEVHIVDR